MAAVAASTSSPVAPSTRAFKSAKGRMVSVAASRGTSRNVECTSVPKRFPLAARGALTVETNSTATGSGGAADRAAGALVDQVPGSVVAEAVDLVAVIASGSLQALGAALGDGLSTPT